MKKALLIRVGIDYTCGAWNAPMDPHTREFAYVPIPENPGTVVYPEYNSTYEDFKEPCEKIGCPIPSKVLECPSVHLDPDFSELTYGDVDGKDVSTGRIHHRGKPIRELNDGDILVFYAGLEPVKRGPEEDRLVCAIIGLYVVDDKPISAIDLVIRGERPRNAHARRDCNEADIIVLAKRDGKSGRLTKCIPIGKRRGKGKQYRLTEDLRDKWGGLWVENRCGKTSKVNDGWIQRSVNLPAIGNPTAFYDWFLEELDNGDIQLVEENNLD